MQDPNQLSENEQRILQKYHQRSKLNTVTNSETKLKQRSEQENVLNPKTSYRSEAPARVLKTKIFNDSHSVIKPLPVPIPNPKPKNPRSSSTPRQKTTPKKLKKSLNTSKGSSKAKSSSRNSSFTKLKKKKPVRQSSAFNTLDITRIPNWKYEINKLVRTVFRHSVLCSNLREEAGRIGGLKILDEYRKYNNS